MIYFLLKHRHNPDDIKRVCKDVGGTTLQKWGGSWIVNGLRRNPEFNKTDIGVRWGGMFTVPFNVVNSREAVLLVAHKSRTRKALQGKVPIPRTWWDADKAQIPFIARPSTHSHGNRFYVIKTEKERKDLKKGNLNGFYYSELIDIKEEYRVYVGHEKILGCYKKSFKEGELRANRAITGLSWGDMVLPPDDVGKIAVEACKALNLDTGAVDVLVAQEPMIIEVNSTPAISTEECRNMYIKYFKWIDKKSNSR